MKDVVLDAGALIALERGKREVRALVLLAERGVVTLTTSSAAVAQVWRSGARQARLARFLASDLVVESPLDPAASRNIGVLASTTGGSDVVDGHVALLALERAAVVVTSDPADLVVWGVDPRNIVRC
ncbi:MAG: PIN domain-containing protein [Polyangiaceae bacterium]|nr:PIN domain-containing protein [Polyangiaceae bacterium]